MVITLDIDYTDYPLHSKKLAWQKALVSLDMLQKTMPKVPIEVWQSPSGCGYHISAWNRIESLKEELELREVYGDDRKRVEFDERKRSRHKKNFNVLWSSKKGRREKPLIRSASLDKSGWGYKTVYCCPYLEGTLKRAHRKFIRLTYFSLRKPLAIIEARKKVRQYARKKSYIPVPRRQMKLERWEKRRYPPWQAKLEGILGKRMIVEEYYTKEEF